jgi:hypothetical protein
MTNAATAIVSKETVFVILAGLVNGVIQHFQLAHLAVVLLLVALLLVVLAQAAVLEHFARTHVLMQMMANVMMEVQAQLMTFAIWVLTALTAVFVTLLLHQAAHLQQAALVVLQAVN